MLKLFKNLTKGDWLFAAVSLVCIVGQVYLDLKLPDYMSEITTLVETQGSAMSDILHSGVLMLGCALGSLILSIIVTVMAAKIATHFSAALRKKIFDKVQSFSMEEIGHFSTASLITRSTNDITQIQNLIVMGMQAIIRAPIMTVWGIIKIAGKNWQWTAAVGVSILFLLLIVVVCVGLAIPKFKRVQALTDDLNRVTRENLTGLSVVRAYNAEDYQEQKFEKTNTDLTDTNIFVNTALATLMPGIQLVMNGCSLAIYWIGAVMINAVGIEERIGLFSDMVVFSSYAMNIMMAFMMLVMIFIMLPRASVSAKRILEVLETKPTIMDGSVTNGKTDETGEVEFRNVSFCYPDAGEAVISNISFTAHKGQTVALIGSTGCGKSTVINLIPRFYDATEGEVLVDGVNVKEYNGHSLRSKIGYISQKSILFGGTIAANVAFGECESGNPSAEDVQKAIETAQASDFVKEKGTEGKVAQGGTNFSGGQKQRLSIARAICRKPEIFIFDDSFSALDYKTDRNLRKALDKNCADATKIIVAQRIGTIRDADLILVLDDGKIVGQGRHAELMKTCEVYRQIAYSQLSKEELAV